MKESANPPFSSAPLCVEDLFLSGCFEPAPVQRSYEWGAIESETLLRDIDAAFSAHEAWRAQQEGAPSSEILEDLEFGIDPLDEEAELYNSLAPPTAEEDEDEAFDVAEDSRELTAPLREFSLGTIVLMPKVDAIELVYEIFDGLQRLTTLTILLSVLRDFEGESELQDRLSALIWFCPRYRMRWRKRTEALENNVQKLGAARKITRIPPHNQLIRQLHDVKEVFLNKMRGWPAARRQRFVEYLLDHVWLEVVSPKDPRLARQIFVSTNLHGKRLSAISVLKGQIGDLATNDEEADEIISIWDQVSADLGPRKFDDFMRAIDMIERATPQGDQWPTDLGAYLADSLPPGRAARWMRRLDGYARSWRDMNQILSKGGETEIERDLWRLRAFHWREWRPLALYYWRSRAVSLKRGRLRGAEAAFYEHIFDRLHRRCMAFTLLSSPGARQSVFAKAIAQARRRRNPMIYAQRRKGDAIDGALVVRPAQRQKIDRVLLGQIRDRDLWAPLIDWLEMSEWRADAPELMRKVTTEHVLPRNPPNAANEFIRYGGAENYDQLCYALGNLAVVAPEVNDKVANKPYAEKRPVFEAEAMKYTTIADVASRAQWGPDEIMARTERLRLQVWRELGYDPPAR